MTEKLIKTFASGWETEYHDLWRWDEALAIKNTLSPAFTIYDYEPQKLNESQRIDAFVIVDQMIAHQLEFGKIMDYCGQAKAGIYDIIGRDLYRICREAEERGWCSHDELLDIAEDHDYISFDVLILY